MQSGDHMIKSTADGRLFAFLLKEKEQLDLVSKLQDLIKEAIAAAQRARGLGWFGYISMVLRTLNFSTSLVNLREMPKALYRLSPLEPL